MPPSAPRGPAWSWSAGCPSATGPRRSARRSASASPPAWSSSGSLAGEDEAQQHGIVGDTPNLAARLQALAEPNTVVIEPTTHRLTGGLFDYRDLGAVTLKGFAEPVQAWQVMGLERRGKPLRGPA